jgi:hypothetical protein
VNAAPAVEVFAPQAKILSSDTRVVEHNPTYESMYTPAEVCRSSPRRGQGRGRSLSFVYDDFTRPIISPGDVRRARRTRTSGG